jgi:hypothetical protein
MTSNFPFYSLSLYFSKISQKTNKFLITRKIKIKKTSKNQNPFKTLKKTPINNLNKILNFFHRLMQGLIHDLWFPQIDIIAFNKIEAESIDHQRLIVGRFVLIVCQSGQGDADVAEEGVDEEVA